MKDTHEQIRKFFESLPDKFNLLEEGIDLETQKEYIDLSHRFERGELTEEETLNLGAILLNPKTPIEAKKKALSLLTHLGTILAFRQIEKYRNDPDQELKQWSALALQECKMFLESELMEESSGFIASGMGGLHDRLRFYFLILPSTERAFKSTEKNIIKDEITLVSKNLNSIVEFFDFSDTFVGMIVLIPMDVAVGTFIETGIKNCNELGNFVFEHYYVTNQGIPDEAEIKDIIKIVKDGE